MAAFYAEATKLAASVHKRNDELEAHATLGAQPLAMNSSFPGPSRISAWVGVALVPAKTRHFAKSWPQAGFDMVAA